MTNFFFLRFDRVSLFFALFFVFSYCTPLKDPNIKTVDGKTLLEERLTFFPQEEESGDSVVYRYNWLPFGSTSFIQPNEKMVVGHGFTNDYKVVLIEGDSVRVLEKNVVNIEGTFLLEAGKKVPCLAYSMALGGAWNIIRMDGKVIATINDNIQHLPKLIAFVEGESSNMVIYDEEGQTKTILR